MPANISERNGQPAIMVVGEPAWHRLGKLLDTPATAREAIQAALLDWTVIKQPLFAGEQEHHRVPDYYAVVRGDDWGKQKANVLGIVRGAYTPLQNREAFRFFDPIVGEGAAVYHTAGALGNGERVWILAKLPDDITGRIESSVSFPDTRRRGANLYGRFETSPNDALISFGSMRVPQCGQVVSVDARIFSRLELRRRASLLKTLYLFPVPRVR